MEATQVNVELTQKQAELTQVNEESTLEKQRETSKHAGRRMNAPIGWKLELQRLRGEEKKPAAS